MKKIKAFRASLEDIVTVTKRELILGVLSCALAGIVFGVFFSPKKTVMIGCNNGNTDDFGDNGEDEQSDDE